MIHEFARPKPAQARPLPANLAAGLAWSKPVGELAVRVELISSDTVFVRMKNVSDKPLSVPTGNPHEEQSDPLFECYVQAWNSPWRKVSPLSEEYVPEPAKRDGPLRLITVATRPWVTLRPGEDCIALFRAADYEDLFAYRTPFLKVVLRQPHTGDPMRWSGIIETPPKPPISRQDYPRMLESIPSPDHFPPLSYNLLASMYPPSPCSETELLYLANRTLINLLRIYEPAAVRAELERRIHVERDKSMRLLLAAIAAHARSEQAAIILLESLRATDYPSVENVQCALELAARWVHCFWLRIETPNELPDWLVELILATVNDERPLLVPVEMIDARTVAECGVHLLDELGKSRSRWAVPVLVEWARIGREGALQCLGDIGDKRAVPPLLEMLREDPEDLYVAETLSQLGSRESVPTLLRFIEIPRITASLAATADPRAIPVLQEIIAQNGKLIRDGNRLSPYWDPDRVFQARIALCTWDPDGGVARLAALYADNSITRDQRYAVVMKLRSCPDPMAIPALVNVIRIESDPSIIEMAISGLGESKYKAAVDGLIASFDVDFKAGGSLGKGKLAAPEAYRDCIGRSLHYLTGQRFGADKQQWLRWWKDEGRDKSHLK